MAGQQEKKRRPGFTTAELEEIWNRWERGESSVGIARALGRGWNVYYVVARSGGADGLLVPVLLPVRQVEARRDGRWGVARLVPERLFELDPLPPPVAPRVAPTARPIRIAVAIGRFPSRLPHGGDQSSMTTDFGS